MKQKERDYMNMSRNELNLAGLIKFTIDDHAIKPAKTHVF